MFESTLEAALSLGDVPELKSTQDIDKYADFIDTAVNKAIPTSKNGGPESQPASEESLALIKEKHSLRQQYSQAHDPLIEDNLRIESQASWEKFCNDISLETNILSLGVKSKTSSNQRVSAIIRLCDLMRKPPRLRLIRLFAESVKRHFCIQSDNFDNSNHFDEVNQFIEDNYEYFYPPGDPDDYRSDMDDNYDLVADIDSDTLIRIVKFLN